MAAVVVPGVVEAEFFGDPELDFWHEEPRTPPAPSGKAAPVPVVRKLDEGEFRWEDYENPQHPRFWDDGGDYVPPLAYRVTAADPTPENVRRLLAWQRRKIDTASRVQEEINRQQAATATPPPSPKQAPAAVSEGGVAPGAVVPARQVNWRNLTVLFFHSATCPHCQASVPTVQALRAKGATVVPVQTDWMEQPPLLPEATPYTQEMQKRYPVNAVPTWLAVYEGDNITLQGNVTEESLERTLQEAERMRRQETKRQ